MGDWWVEEALDARGEEIRSGGDDDGYVNDSSNCQSSMLSGIWSWRTMVSVLVESMRQVGVGVCDHVFVEKEVSRKAWV